MADNKSNQMENGSFMEPATDFNELSLTKKDEIDKQNSTYIKIIAASFNSFRRNQVEIENSSGSSVSLDDNFSNYELALKKSFSRPGASKDQEKLPTIISEPRHIPIVPMNRDFEDSIKSFNDLNVFQTDGAQSSMQKCIIDVESLIKDFDLYERVQQFQKNLLFGHKKVFLEINEFLTKMEKYFSQTFNLLRSLNETCERLKFEPEKIIIAEIISFLIKNSCVFVKHPNQLLIAKQKQDFKIKILVNHVILHQEEIQLYLLTEAEAKMIATSNFNGDISTKFSKSWLKSRVFDLRSNQIEIDRINNIITFRQLEKELVIRESIKVKKEEQKLCFLVIINYTINESNGVIWKLSIPLTVSDNKKAGLSRARIFWENIHLKVSNQFYDVPLSLKWKDIRKALNEEFSAIGGNIPENNFNSLFNILLNIEATPIRNKFGPEAPDADINFKCFAKDEFIVAYKMFRRTSISFFNWFYSALELIRDDEVLLGLWKENLITGFVGRDEASRMLIGTLPGTFVVRFSETKIGTLIISYRGKHEKIHHISPLDKNAFKNESLATIICETLKLRKLYPHTDKSAFEKFNCDDEIGDSRASRSVGYFGNYMK